MDLDQLTPQQRYEVTGVYYPRVPVCRRPEYEITYENFEEVTFLHMEMKAPWTPRVRRQFQVDLNMLLALHGGPGFVVSPAGDKKHHKFLSQFGFECVGPITMLDGSAKLIFRIALTPESKKKNEQRSHHNHLPTDPIE